MQSINNEKDSKSSEIPESKQNTESLTELTHDVKKLEATLPGQRFTDAFLKIKRLVHAEPSYRTQVDVWNTFAAELIFGVSNRIPDIQDRIITDLEEQIAWKDV